MDETIFNEQERRLRELNGVLDMAVLIAIDVIVEHDSHGLSHAEWQRRVISMAARKLADVQQFAGRFSLFTDEELRVLAEQEISDEALAGEVTFELTRRGLGKLQEAVV